MQIEDVLLEIVYEASRGADEDIDTLFDGLALTLVAGPAIGELDALRALPAQHQGVLVDLDGKLARGRKDQGARLVWPPRGERGHRQEAVKHRKQERRGLAGPGLGLTRHVVAGERLG